MVSEENLDVETNSNRRLDLEWYYLFLIIPPIIVFVSGEFFITKLGNSSLPFPSSGIFVDGANYMGAVGQYHLLAAFLFHLGVSVAIIAIFMLDFLRLFTKKSIIIGGIGFFILSLTVVTGVIFGPEIFGSKPTHSFAGAALFVNALDLYSGLPPCPEAQIFNCECNESGVVGIYTCLVDLVNIFTSVSAPACIVGMIMSLSVLKENRHQNDVQILADGQRLCQKYMYLSSILLASGVLMTVSWISWPESVLKNEFALQHGEIVNGIALYYGVVFSLIILSIFLPTELILFNRAENIARSHLNDTVAPTAPTIVEKWKEDHGLSFAPMDAIKITLALAFPLLTGAFGSVSSLLNQI